jgi:dynein heavy chain
MLTALWCRDLQAAEYRPLLTTLFSRYVDVCLEHCRRNFKTVVPLVAVNQVGLHGVGS